MATTEEEPPFRYQIRDRIGSGNCGVVYTCTDGDDGTIYAIKVLSLEAGDNAGKQAFREIDVQRRVAHPNIVEIFDAGQHADRPFIVMEYVKHRPFEEWVAGQSWDKRRRVAVGAARQALLALGHAHENGVVHRDIKPSNLLLSAKSGKLLVKVADFGMAKDYLTAGLSGITRTYQPGGTPAYAAPEQLEDSRSAKPAADIFSVSATLYEFLCGEPPFEPITNILDLLKRAAQPAIPIQDRAPYISDDLAAVVHKGLSQAQSDRYASAEEMREALKPFLKKGLE